MGKHSKNAGVMGSESLTYHERKALGFGTVTERLGKVRRWGRVCGIKALRVGPGPTTLSSHLQRLFLARRTRLATFTTAA